MFASPVNYRVFVRVMELWSLTAISRQAAKLKSIYITKCDIMNYSQCINGVGSNPVEGRTKM